TPGVRSVEPASDDLDRRLQTAITDRYPHETVSDWIDPKRRAVQRYEQVAAVLGREILAAVKRQPKGCAVGGQLHGRWLRPGATVGIPKGRIGDTLAVAERKAVVAARLQDVDLVGWEVLAQLVAFVVGDPEATAARLEGEPDGVPK